MTKFYLLLALLFLPLFIYGQNDFELNTILMNSTFRIEGSGRTGTIFILGKISRKDSSRAYYVLVTANHVLNDIKTDEATLFLREENNNTFVKTIHPIKIRNNGTPLWVKHPDVDVAAMYVPLPRNIKINLLPTEFLATDSIISKVHIHPGDELICLGYPYGASANDAGFPILRSGKIASYPILPTKLVKKIVYDFNVFGGNSGGPVYFIGQNRSYDGAVQIGEVRFLMGLVSEQILIKEEIKSMDETIKKDHPLGLANVIPATFIRETIELLPDLDKYR